VGHARTFWTAWQRAQNASGALILRMEDLDRDRSRPEYADAALEDLHWLGIGWHEGPDKGGPFAPYQQSERLSQYLCVWRRLWQSGYLYPCRCSRKDLASALSAPHEGSFPEGTHVASNSRMEPLDDEPIYPGTCREREGKLQHLRGASDAEIEMPGEINWRFRVPDGEAVEFEDKNLGLQRFVAGRDFGDFLVWRKDGFPAYQLACVADDHAMEITEVVRGSDLLKSTARQILLNRALGYTDPDWFHCRLVVDHNGRRLAKRHDSLSLRALRQRGLTPTNILSADLSGEA
jgi:glutamyl-tRNA synthetase